MIRLSFTFILLAFSTLLFSQHTQTVKGWVLDDASGQPIPYASVILLNTTPLMGAVSDSTGNFVIDRVPVGRYDVQVSHLNYTGAILREVVVSSAKQTQVQARLKENVSALDEVIIRTPANNAMPLNTMAFVSADMLSVEEAKRYAGGFDDPARLASAFAGVAGNTDTNGIIVRGNAPKYVQWKMEGIEIPNPNHFGDLQVIGGGALTALSNQMLANSDFLTGAFPAEYNNALSGVFDINLRKGSNQQQENTFQVGIIGIDASSEGPFRKGGQSSYLFNYRYSTLALIESLLPENANSIKYQDLSFKLNFPSRKLGTFTLWGLGLTDQASAKAKTNPSDWIYEEDRNNDNIKQNTQVAGVNHHYFINNNTSINTSLAVTSGSVDWNTERLSEDGMLYPDSKINNTNQNLIFKTFVNTKFNPGHVNKTGIVLTGMRYKLQLYNAIDAQQNPLLLVNSKGFTTLLSAYSSSMISLSDRLTLQAGMNAQLFTLNGNYTLEPRMGLRQQITEKQSLGFAYGLHSRLENLNYYFNDSFETGEKAINKDIDFTKAHHLVLNYEWNVSDLVRIKVEPYFQFLYDVPVVANSSFSFVNMQADWFFDEKLVNEGEARNYGIDFTLEKFMSKGYYFLTTASLFDARYSGGDNIWRNTRYNRQYVTNFLFGKEWILGRKASNVLGVNTRFTYQGGNHYTPLDVSASIEAKEAIYDESRAYEYQLEPGVNVHITASYKINKKRTTHEVALKILNLTGQSDFYGYKYNYQENTLEKDVASVVIPNISYRLEF